MALIKEFYDKGLNGVDLYRTYSDKNFMIRKVGTDEIYEDAIDSQDYEYEETDILIDQDITTIDEATNEDYIEALERLGVS